MDSSRQNHAMSAAVRQALSRPGRISGMLAAAAPSVVFVIANALSSLYPALIAAGAVALTALAWRLSRRESWRQAAAGLVIVAACAGVAAVTGQARGFFLIPALLPFAIIAICVVSVVAKRPLTGLILNRVSGGPADWPEIPRLRRVYAVTTLVCAAVNVVNAALQTTFYLKDDTFVLAAAHIATGPVFAVIVAVTVVAARNAMPGARSRAAS
jgi:hypothetical protein